MEVKRIISFILVIAMLFSFAACGKNQTTKPEDEVKDNSQVIEPPEENEGKIEITPVVTNECTVTFYYNYGNNDIYKTVNIESGKTVDEPEDPEREGYSFDGWYTEKEDGEKFDFESVISEDIDLYARWNRNSETSTEAVSTHTVTFYYNYGDNDVYKTVKVENGETVEKPEDPERKNYSFEGWYTAKENGEEFDFDSAITEDIDLYAHWEKKSVWGSIFDGWFGGDDEEEEKPEENITYTVTFVANADGVVGMPENQKVSAGECAVEPAEPTREGYVFSGWYSDSDTLVPFYFNTAIYEDITLYAKWVLKYENDAPDLYNITEIIFNEETGEIDFKIQTNRSCDLRYYVVEDEGTGILYESAVPAAENLNYEYITDVIPISVLPTYYKIVAVLTDTTGKFLCDEYIYYEHTKVYIEFMEKTIFDFPSESVINLDTSYDNNFMVANEETDIFIHPEFSTEFDQDANTYVFSGNISELQALSIGDQLAILTEDNAYALQVESLHVSENEITVKASDNVNLAQFFDYVKINQTVDVSQADAFPEQQSRNARAQIVASKNFPLPTIKIGDVDLDINVGIGVKFVLNFEKNSDFYEVKLVMDLSSKGRMHGTITEWGSSKTEYSHAIPRFVVPLAIPGLGAEAGVKFFSKKNAELEIETALELGIAFGYQFSSYGNKPVFEPIIKMDDPKLNLSGGVEFGLAPYTGVTFLGGLITLSFNNDVGIELKGQLQTDLGVDIPGDPDIHMCDQCISVNVAPFYRPNLSGRINLFINPIEVPNNIATVKVFPGKFFMSLINSEDTLYKGKVVWGSGNCQNYRYLMDLQALNTATGENKLNARIYNSEYAKVYDGATGVKEYFYPGTYLSEVEYNNIWHDTGVFSVKKAGDIVLEVSGKGKTEIRVSSDGVTVDDYTFEIYNSSNKCICRYSSKNPLVSSDNGAGSCSILLPYGDYQLHVYADGYSTESGKKSITPFKVKNDIEFVEVELVKNICRGNLVDRVYGDGVAYANVKVTDEHGNVFEDISSNMGGFAINISGNGEYKIEITSPYYYPFEKQFTVTKGKYVFKNLYLDPLEDASLSGRFVDASKQPVAGVTISAKSRFDDSITKTESDVNGCFQLSLPDWGLYDISYESEKYKSNNYTSIYVDRAKSLGDIVLRDAPTFTITHGTDNILAMGSVEMYNGIGYQTWTINSSEPWRISTNDGDWFTLSVNGERVYLGSDFDAGKTELKLNINKYTDSRNNGTLAFTAGDKTYTVEIFQKAYSITGTVVAGGAPVSGAKVTVSNEYYTSAELTTGVDGKFTVAVPNGWYSVTVTAEGYKPVTLGGSVEMKGANVDIGEIILEEPVVISLTGTVRDGDENSPTYGKALEGVSFEVYDSAGKKVGDTVKSNENGIVAFDFPAAGTYKFVFSLVGYETVTVDAVIINENTPSIGTYVMMRSEYTTSVSGTTAPGTKLELLDENGNVIAETVADENGNYEFKDIPGWDGTIFRIRIKDTTIIVDTVGGATDVVIDATVAIFTVSVPDPVEIENKVGATAEWTIESSHPWTVTATGDTSWFTLSSTSGECGITEFTVTANSVTDDYRESVLTFALNNKTFEVTIYQDIARTTISGTTTPGTKLELLDEDGNVIAETVADENGNYEFKDIPGWDGTIFIIRIKDTTITTEVIGGATDVVIDATIAIFTISVPEVVEIGNEVGAISEWEGESSHPWTVTKSGDTSWYTLSAESGKAGTLDLVVTANGATDSYRESTLTFALNNRTFDVTIYQNFIRTVSGSIVEQTENSDEAGIEGVQIVVRKAGTSSQYLHTETDANGQYTLVFEDAGDYVITAEKSGYTTATVDFSVSSETAEIEKITMTKTDSPYYFNGHTYLPIFPSESYISWEEAEAICESFGGHLVSITSEAENDFVNALTEKGIFHEDYTHTAEWWWIGAHKENGSWAWSDGEEFGSYTNWMKEPGSAALYGLMYAKADNSWSGYWQSIEDNGTRRAGIVCEWDYEVEHLEGVCDNNLKWKLTIDGMLTISGQGILSNADYNTAPWKNLEHNISKVELKSGITEIGKYGLNETSYAAEVILPDTLKTISEYSSYLDSYYRKNYTVSADNTVYASVDGVLFTKDMATLIEYPQSNERTEYSIPDGVKTIENLNGNYLEIINIPASVSEWNLRYVNFDSMEEFNVDPDNTVFSDIDGVLFNKAGNALVKYPSAKPVEVNTYCIPDGVTTINDGAFYEITITDWNNHAVGIVFPASVTTIGYDNFFFEDRYHTQTDLYFEGNAPLIDNYYGRGSDSEDGILEYTTVYYTSGKSGWTSPTWYPSYKEWNNETKLTNICIPTVLIDAYATVSGQVVDENGYPLENVKIQGKFGDEFTGIAYTDYDGTYYFQFESATTCDFRYYLEGYETVFVDAVDIAEGEYSFDTVTMTQGVSLLGSGTTGVGNNWTLLADELVITCGESNSSGIYYLNDYFDEAIQEYSFWSPNDMMQIRKINIGEGITTLRISNISDDLSVKELYIGADVRKIEWSGNGFIYDYMSGDTEIVIDPANSNYVITDGALYTSDHKTLMLAPQNDYSTTTYTIREGVEVVGEYALSNACYETINIPDTVSTLESSSFAYSYYLESIHIPSSVTSIDGNVFHGCDNLSVITVDAANAEYMAVDNVLYNKTQTMLIAVPCTFTGSFTIPDGIKTIADYAMDDTMLERIIIPSSVTSINHYSIATHYSNTACKIYFLGDVPETVSYYAFGHYFEGTLYYLEGASGWSTPTTVINGVTYKTQPFTMDELN